MYVLYRLISGDRTISKLTEVLIMLTYITILQIKYMELSGNYFKQLAPVFEFCSIDLWLII